MGSFHYECVMPLQLGRTLKFRLILKSYLTKQLNFVMIKLSDKLNLCAYVVLQIDVRVFLEMKQSPKQYYVKFKRIYGLIVRGSTYIASTFAFNV